GLSVAVKQVILRDSSFSNQLLEQHLAKASRVGDRQPDVLIEMKHLNMLPVEVGHFGERVQEFQLRSRCRGDDARLAIIPYSAPNGRGSLLRRRVAQRDLVVEYSQQHEFHSLKRRTLA